MSRIYDATRWLFLPDRRRAVELLEVQAGDRVLDFGCGTGWSMPRLRASQPAEITGVDCSPAMLARARRRHPDVRFIQGDITRVHLRERAQRILCMYALSLVDDREQAIRNLHRHLRPDGTLVLLDFHRLHGAWRAADPLLRWWLGWFGVRPPLDVLPLLHGLFGTVETHVRHSGYDILIRCRSPRGRRPVS